MAMGEGGSGFLQGMSWQEDSWEFNDNIRVARDSLALGMRSKEGA